MVDRPRSRVLFGGGPWPSGQGVTQFESATDCLNFMFGPPQHDRHVQRWRTHQWLTAERATYSAREHSVLALLDEWRERDRKRAAQPLDPETRAYFDEMNKRFEEGRARRAAEYAAQEQGQ